MTIKKDIYRTTKAVLIILALWWLCATPSANAQFKSMVTDKYKPSITNFVKTDSGTVAIVKQQGNGSSAYKQEPNEDGPSSPFSDTVKENETSHKNLWDKIKDTSNSIVTSIKDTGNNIINMGKTIANGTVTAVKSFAKCSQQTMDQIYQSSCYACQVISSLLKAFLNATEVLENVSKDAGRKILLLGFILWIAFYVLKQVSSWKNIEPASMVNDILIMLFKIFGAWLVIGFGFDICVDYVLIPFLGWGVDFGNQLLSGVSASTGIDITDKAAQSDLITSSGGFLPAKFLNNLISYVAAVDHTTSQHLKLGHMIICYSVHAETGSWGPIPNIWIMLCGMAIWCLGFMMTLSVMYYLVDMSFKLALSLIILPIAVGLWPFGITRDRFKACIKIILNAAGIFIFLAMTTSVGLVLVDKAIDVGSKVDGVNGGIQSLYSAIERNDEDALIDRFLPWGSCFILLVFAYLYALKVIGSTLDDYVDKFFSDSILGKQSPMHHHLTEVLSMASNKVSAAGSMVSDIATHQMGVGLVKASSFMSRKGSNGKDGSTLDKIKSGRQFEPDEPQQEQSKLDTLKQATNLEAKDGKEIGDEVSGKKGSDQSGETSAGAQAVNAAGEGMKASGEAVKQSSKATADAVRSGGGAAAAVGDALSPATFGASAAVGHTVDAAAKVGATGVEAGGQIAGEGMKASGEAMKKSATVMDKAEKAARNAGKAAKGNEKVTSGENDD